MLLWMDQRGLLPPGLMLLFLHEELISLCNQTTVNLFVLDVFLMKCLMILRCFYGLIEGGGVQECLETEVIFNFGCLILFLLHFIICV